MRALYRFGKINRIRFVSHLDLQRFMQMAIRRTELPIAYSQGFNPHPILSFASALAMGWTSEYEVLDLRFSRDVSPDFAKREMARALPPDMPLHAVRLVPDRHPSMMSLVRAARYRVQTSNAWGKEAARAVSTFLSMNEVIAMRKTKSGETPVNIRPWCLSLAVEMQHEESYFDMVLRLEERATLKPDLLLKTLAGPDGDAVARSARIHRVALLGEDSLGKLTELMRL